MRFLSAILVAMSMSSAAQATAPEPWLVKSATCASGQLNPEGTLKVGSLASAPAVRSIPADQGTVVETDKEAVLTVIVSGDNTGACRNDNQKTILMLVFSK